MVIWLSFRWIDVNTATSAAGGGRLRLNGLTEIFCKSGSQGSTASRLTYGPEAGGPGLSCDSSPGRPPPGHRQASNRVREPGNSVHLAHTSGWISLGGRGQTTTVDATNCSINCAELPSSLRPGSGFRLVPVHPGVSRSLPGSDMGRPRTGKSQSNSVSWIDDRPGGRSPVAAQVVRQVAELQRLPLARVWHHRSAHVQLAGDSQFKTSTGSAAEQAAGSGWIGLSPPSDAASVEVLRAAQDRSICMAAHPQVAGGEQRAGAADGEKPPGGRNAGSALSLEWSLRPWWLSKPDTWPDQPLVPDLQRAFNEK